MSTTKSLDVQRLEPDQIDAVRRVLEQPKYELIPLKNVLDQSEFLPDGATVSVTASPQKGMSATVDLTLELVSRGFDAIPHISA